MCPEFQQALELDPKNVELRRELAFLLLQMDRPGEAEREFRALAEPPPGDLLAVAQLGFLLYGRGREARTRRHFSNACLIPTMRIFRTACARCCTCR